MKLQMATEHHEISPDGVYLRMISESEKDEILLSDIQFALQLKTGACAGIGNGSREDGATVLELLLAEVDDLGEDSRRHLGLEA